MTHAQPFYCPYCGEEDFAPHGDETSAYLCRSCARVYSIKFLGVAVAPDSAPERS
ncbi:MAG TPA: hypothetical protein VFS38_02665 [Actinomycetota bacterium]|nr:hypothetical protein [Actinomycetota bacterium]